jgi:hypothetical protein
MQLELTVPEFHNAKAADRQRLLVMLRRLLDQAWQGREHWYLWILAYGAQDHDHNLRRADGTPADCPVYGCDAVRTR